jgi:hypothetical protein
VVSEENAGIGEGAHRGGWSERSEASVPLVVLVRTLSTSQAQLIFAKKNVRVVK